MPDMGSGDLDDLSLDSGDEEAESTGIDANANDDAPVVKFVNKILVDAIKRGASDIHFEPFETQYRVRLRMDGMLRAVASPPMKLASRISSRIKVMARPGYRGAPHTAGRPHQAQPVQEPRGGLPREHAADPVRRKDRAAYPGRLRRQARHRRAGL